MSSERLGPAMLSWEAGDLDGAAALFREIAATGDPEASHLLACLLQDMGDLDGAEAAHRSVIQSDDPVFAQRSAIAMALMLVSACEWPAAHRVLSIAADGADFEVAALADTAMVLVCTELGDAAGAEAALRRARRCDSPAVAELAAQLELPDFAFLTAATAAELYEVAEDEEDYQRLLTCGDPEVVSQSAFQLYRLYAEEEDYEAARQVCEHAVAVGHPDHLAMAYKLLGAVLVNLGEYAEAADAYARAAEDPRPELRLPALLEQAKVHAQLGDEETTRAIFHRVIASGQREYAVEAHACLAQLHTEAGEAAQALTALRAVLEAGESPWSSPCVTLLALLLDQHPSSYEPAMELVRAAAAHPDPDTAYKAALLLDQDARRQPPADPVEEQALQDADSGLARLRAGEVAEARRLLRRAVDSGAHAQSIRATVALAELEIGEGDREQADELLSYVAQGDDVAQGFTAAFLLHLLRTSEGHPVLRAIVDHQRLGRQEGLIRHRAAMDHDPATGAAVLAQLLAAAGYDLAEAARLFESAADSGDPLALSYTAVSYKELLLGHGRRDEAIGLLRRARADGHPVLAPWVAYELAELVGGGDPTEAQATDGEAQATDGEARAAYGEVLATEHEGLRRAAVAGLVRVLERQGDLLAIGRLYERLVAEGDTAGGDWLLGLTRVRLDEVEEARAAFDLLPGDDPEHGTAGQARIGLGERLVDEGEHSRAELCLLPATREAESAESAWRGIGVARRLRGDLEGAVEALEAAMPAAAVDLAEVLEERGDVAAARRALESGVAAGDVESLRHLLVHLVRHEAHEAVPGWAGQAVGSGDPETVAMGHWSWGEACRAAGDLDGAVLRFREALAAGYADAVPSIRGDLAQALRDTGDAAAAAEQARLVMAEDDPDAAARSALDLGCWLHEDGDPLGAAEAFAAAVRARPESEEAGTAAANLVILAEHACEGGEHALAVRILSHLGADAAEPARRLGGLCTDPAAVPLYFGLAGADPYIELEVAGRLAELGETGEARAVYERLNEHEDPDVRFVAAGRLLELLDEQGETAAFYSVAEQRAGDDGVFGSLFGLLQEERGDTEASLRTLRAAAAGGEPTALTVLAQALAGDGQVEEARQVYEQVLEAGDADLAARAMVGLGNTFHEEDGLRARVWYLKAVTAAEGHVAAVAAMHLGALAKGERDFPEALGWYQRVIDAGDPESAMAAAHLGELCYWLGDRDGALRFYELTLNLTGRPELVAEAACRLGEIRYEHGDLPAARRLLEQAVATGDDLYAAEAEALLTKL
ncbi:tetratricopeptide repeat protein [Nonomuraea glycinis]|uniref:Tetratricopeptide repeat protein n=1 Tax=Nonomuraea glycinis TaxID=2047744 RepID=A0A918A5P8_9ACTN|nr:tetratricopeptide repeat protein [Nonomuraea glycinis]MCA2176533.1 tetratricopeptide repeat protein [Nonomuraea glycinis]GGP06975.1 hypothetical protein GCM10012278_32890 [Nonomuraea glycinis]